MILVNCKPKQFPIQQLKRFANEPELEDQVNTIVSLIKNDKRVEDIIFGNGKVKELFKELIKEKKYTLHNSDDLMKDVLFKKNGKKMNQICLTMFEIRKCLIPIVNSNENGCLFHQDKYKEHCSKYKIKSFIDCLNYIYSHQIEELINIISMNNPIRKNVSQMIYYLKILSPDSPKSNLLGREFGLPSPFAFYSKRYSSLNQIKDIPIHFITISFKYSTIHEISIYSIKNIYNCEKVGEYSYSFEKKLKRSDIVSELNLYFKRIGLYGIIVTRDLKKNKHLIETTFLIQQAVEKLEENYCLIEIKELLEELFKMKRIQSEETDPYLLFEEYQFVNKEQGNVCEGVSEKTRFY